MDTEWDLRTRPQRWVLTIGEWHAVIQRVDGPGYLWRASLETTSEPLLYFEGPTTTSLKQGQAWCLTKIMELHTAINKHRHVGE
jgi:hypothetical protein